MNEMAQKIIDYYRLMERKISRKIILILCVGWTLILTIFFKIIGMPLENVRSFLLGLCFLSFLFLVQCVYLEIKERIHMNEVIKFENSRDISDVLTNLLDIKKLHNLVVSELEKYNLQSFANIEESRYKAMWISYFFDWFMFENDKIHYFRAEGKGEIDDVLIAQKFNKLNSLQQQLLQEFSFDSKFEQILDDHFKSLKKDYNNLLILR